MGLKSSLRHLECIPKSVSKSAVPRSEDSRSCLSLRLRAVLACWLSPLSRVRRVQVKYERAPWFNHPRDKGLVSSLAKLVHDPSHFVTTPLNTLAIVGLLIAAPNATAAKSVHQPPSRLAVSCPTQRLSVWFLRLRHALGTSATTASRTSRLSRKRRLSASLNESSRRNRKQF